MLASSSFQAFFVELREVFGPISLGSDAAGGLMSLKQGSQPVANYAIDLRTRLVYSAAHCDTFLNELAPYIKDGLVSFDHPSLFDELIKLTSRLDRGVQARRRELHQGGAEHRSSARLRGSPTAPNLLTVSLFVKTSVHQDIGVCEDICVLCVFVSVSETVTQAFLLF